VIGARKRCAMEPESRRSVWPSTTVRAAATWILAGALFKLFVGSPNDLPPSVREFSSNTLGLGAVLTYQLAIAIELTIGLLAWLRPRLAWPGVAAQLAVFCAVLVPLALSGASSCGCFGSKIPVPPWAMLAVDATLLLALLTARPWRATPNARAPWMAMATAVAASWILPFSLTGDAAVENPSTSSDPIARRAFVDWRPDEWVGQALTDTSFAQSVDVAPYSYDADWVIYSPTCEHCAAYLRRLEGEFAVDPRAYVFVRIPGDPGMERVVDVMPPGEEIVLGVEPVLTPPWRLRVEDGVVRDATHPAD